MQVNINHIILFYYILHSIYKDITCVKTKSIYTNAYTYILMFILCIIRHGRRLDFERGQRGQKGRALDMGLIRRA